MKIIASAAELQSMAEQARLQGRTIGLVPTMGYLHEGHLSLIEIAKKSCDVIITSIFVNPTQFAPNEDFARYPRDIKRDTELCRSAGSTVLFTPEESEMYPDGHATVVSVDGISSLLEGKFRPNHFRGVTTVVAKLFLLAKPHKAFFGQKDAQQCVIVKKLVRDLRFDIEIIVAPIVREGDGLAMSSRNLYLSPQERSEATILHASLCRAEELVKSGERSTSNIVRAMKNMIQQKQSAVIDYAEVVNAETLSALERIEKGTPALAVLAVRFGTTRLIDNALITVQ